MHKRPHGKGFRMTARFGGNNAHRVARAVGAAFRPPGERFVPCGRAEARPYGVSPVEACPYETSGGHRRRGGYFPDFAGFL